jgi:hypothetical protein
MGLRLLFPATSVNIHQRRYDKMRSSRSRPRVVRGITAGAFALATAATAAVGAGALHPARAHAVTTSTSQLPFMCFNTSHTFHQTFGPNSFFLNENQQGPTSFSEGPPTSKPVATLPLYTGTASGHRVYYIITDASDQSVATSLGVNYVPKLANAANTSAVQLSSSSDPKAINVSAGVDFSPTHVLVASATGFPPSQAQAGAVGDPGYSPLVQLPSGVVLNAEQVGDGVTTDGSDKAHWADKVETVNTVNRTVGYNITNGCYENQSVHYISTDSSNPTAAAIEDVTYAPPLGNVPSPDCGTNDLSATPPFINPGCAREDLIAFINGQTGRDNPQRQGENAAILDQESPLNILEDVPNSGGQFNYSPMWDIHFLQWDSSVPVANRLRQTDFTAAKSLVGTQAQSITPSGAASNTFQATGFIVNCPLISIFANN